MSKQRERARANPLTPDDPRHGTVNGYVNWCCRCDACRKAWAAEMARIKRNLAGRLAPDDPRHGKESTYSNHRCRCDACRNAWRIASARRRRGRAQESTAENSQEGAL